MYKPEWTCGALLLKREGRLTVLAQKLDQLDTLFHLKISVALAPGINKGHSRDSRNLGTVSGAAKQ